MSSNVLHEADRGKLAKLLGLLGSNHAGERDAAACAAHRLVQQRGITWHDVINPPSTKLLSDDPQSRRPQPSEWLNDLLFVRRHLKFCSAWEQHFLSSITTSKRLSQKQRVVLAKIADSLRKGGFT